MFYLYHPIGRNRPLIVLTVKLKCTRSACFLGSPFCAATSSQLIPDGGQVGIYTRLAHHREERGEKESTARVLLVYLQLDKSKRETIEKPVTRLEHQFYASKTRYDPIRERVRELA